MKNFYGITGKQNKRVLVNGKQLKNTSKLNSRNKNLFFGTKNTKVLRSYFITRRHEELSAA